MSSLGKLGIRYHGALSGSKGKAASFLDRENAVLRARVAELERALRKRGTRQ